MTDIPNGLPEALPDGERLLWQGRPSVRVLLHHVFHLPWLALYFAVLIGWCVASGVLHGVALHVLVPRTARLAGLACVPLGVIAAYAWLSARNTVYTVTNRRVALRIGVALPATLNVPLARIDAADLRSRADGSGDVALRVAAAPRLSYMVLWPHVLPWHFSRPVPMLRGVRNAEQVADILAEALCVTQPRAVRLPSPTPAPIPALAA
jgi:hypothetical protein